MVVKVCVSLQSQTMKFRDVKYNATLSYAYVKKKKFSLLQYYGNTFLLFKIDVCMTVLCLFPQLSDGSIVAFTVLHNVNCNHGLIYVTSQVQLQISLHQLIQEISVKLCLHAFFRVC